MDGFAVRSQDTVGAEPASPRKLDTFIYLDTGDALPEGYDAVIPIENVESLDEHGEITLHLRRPVSIRIRVCCDTLESHPSLGEDIVQTQLVMSAGQGLRPVDLGAIAAAGYQSIKVARKPRVAILPTGSELVPLGSKLEAGSILEYNSLVLAAQVNLWGGIATRYPITPDRFDDLCARVEEARQDHDMILLNAGSSAGAEDFSAQVVEKLGILLVHGIAVRPGHPVILGIVGNNSDEKTINLNLELPSKRKFPNSGELRKGVVPIIGVPGYPVSAALTGEILVEPIIAKWLGRAPLELPVEKAHMTRKVTSPGGDDDYIRVAVGKVGDKLLATPLPRGAGIISALVRADGLVILPTGVQGVEAGGEVDVRLYRSQRENRENDTLYRVSRHMCLDLLAEFLYKRDRRLTSANVGSLGGLIALKNGEAHFAGSHLLDPDTGEYNISYIKRYLPGELIFIYGFVGREQGLIVKRGNRKKILGLNDLINRKISFVNRQRGAGTRVLLDYHLSKLGIDGDDILGYQQEEYTHLGVAAAVASGRADCGLGIPAAAVSLDLEFISLFQETYQLIIPKLFAESKLLRPLFEVMNEKAFQQAIMGMPGYNVGQMGKLIAEM